MRKKTSNKIEDDEKYRPIIGFDMDGVIIDHTDSKIMLAGKFGITLSPEQTPSDMMHDIIPHEINQQIQDFLYGDRKYALRPQVMRGARTVLKEIMKMELPIFLISRRKNPEIAIELLKKHGLWPAFFNEENAFFVDKPEDKNIRAVRLGITHYLDDERRILENLSGVQNRYLFDRHRIYPEDEFYKLVFSWREFLSNL